MPNDKNCYKSFKIISRLSHKVFTYSHSQNRCNIFSVAKLQNYNYHRNIIKCLLVAKLILLIICLDKLAICILCCINPHNINFFALCVLHYTLYFLFVFSLHSFTFIWFLLKPYTYPKQLLN